MIARTVLNWKSLFLMIAACFFIAAPPLSAQDGGQGYGSQQQGGQDQYQQQYQYQQPEPADVSINDLEKFVDASAGVQKVQSAYSRELGQADDPDKARDLQDKYTGQMIEEIEEAGLSVQEFNQISQAIQQDPELREKAREIATK